MSVRRWICVRCGRYFVGNCAHCWGWEFSKSLESSGHEQPLGFEPSKYLLPASVKAWYPSGGSKA